MPSRSTKETRGSSGPNSPGVTGAVKDLVNATSSYMASRARDKAANAPKPVAKPEPKDLGSGMAEKAGEAVSGRGRQIEKALRDAGV